jgi:hypothetical protein
MATGFSIDVDQAEKACKLYGGTLPQAVEGLRAPIAAVRSFESWNTSPDAAVGFVSFHEMMAVYEDFCETLAQRQIRACDIMDDSAEALREIVAVYRRVDGQV